MSGVLRLAVTDLGSVGAQCCHATPANRFGLVNTGAGEGIEIGRRAASAFERRPLIICCQQLPRQGTLCILHSAKGLLIGFLLAQARGCAYPSKTGAVPCYFSSFPLPQIACN
jgi:hypothetical protein